MNFINKIINRIIWGKQKSVPMTLSDFEYWTGLRLNRDTLNYEFAGIVVTECCVIDAWKRNDLAGLASALFQTYPEIYQRMERIRERKWVE